MFNDDEYVIGPFGHTAVRRSGPSTLLCQMAAHIIAANPDMDPVKAADAAFAIADAITARQEERRRKADEDRREREKERERVRDLGMKLDAQARKTADEWLEVANLDPMLVMLKTEEAEIYNKLKAPREARAKKSRKRVGSVGTEFPELLALEQREQVVQQEIRRIQSENQQKHETLRRETKVKLFTEAGISLERS